jgi:hypothetical protein
MNILVLKTARIVSRDGSSNTQIPSTPGGRALFTVDWFVNGKPVLRNHDDSGQSLVNVHHC